MTFDADAVVAALSDAGVRVDRPLTEADVKRIEKKYGFAFGSFHRELLRTGLPVGDAWLNWRHATPALVKQRLEAPGDGVVRRALVGETWLAAWGPKPSDERGIEDVTREQLALAPTLVPLYGTRYTLADPHDGRGPVLNVDQGVVTVFARDLLDYVDREFGPETSPVTGDCEHVPFWSDLAS